MKKEQKEKEQPKEKEQEPRVAPHTTWMFHKTEGAKIFNPGEVIPDGWRDEPFKKE